ncbi:MAG: peptide ABC transporter substrate-binding protein [Planctomycetales bacterium]|nr:peptide ABC transporter substrate-binding protein [Planctomycetales bacterium]
MRNTIVLTLFLAMLSLSPTWIGCSSKQESASPAEQDAKQGSAATADTSADEAGEEAEVAAPVKPFVLGDMLEPFEPPTLEEIDATAEWIEQPVLDGMELMREEQAKQGEPQLSVEEALALRNNSPADNEKLIHTLGRLAPPDHAGVDFDETFVREAQGDLKSTNPLLFSTAMDGEFSDLAGIGMFGFDRHFTPFASKDSVVSWQTSKDRLMDKLVLRDDLTWSDGRPITAHDVEFSFKVILSDAVPIPAVRSGTIELRYVKAYDDRTLVIFHKEALATNIWNMLFPIIPKHIYEDSLAEDPTMSRSAYHSKLEDNPVVGGAYKLVKRVRGQEFVVERREEFYMHQGKQVRMKPYFKQIRFKVIEDPNTALLALKAGTIDDHRIDTEQWISQTDDDDFYKYNTKLTALGWDSYYICWNFKTPFFEDKQVRQAMSFALDYKEMLNTIFHGLYQPSRGTFHPTSWMFPKENPPEPYQQDLDKAEDLLDAAGWEDSDGDGIRDKMVDGNRVPFQFTLLVHQRPDAIKVGTLLKECLSQIGIECFIKPTEFTVWVEMNRTKAFQASMGVWGTGADPDTQTNIFGTGAGRNSGNYSNPEVDKLFEQARKEFDREKRGELYGEITKLMWEDQPYTWLVYRNSFYGFNKRLRGYTFSPRGPYGFSPGMSGIYKAAMP